MPLPFDATLKDLARRHPRDYVSTFRLGNPSDVHALNVDLSVISAATDVVFRIWEIPAERLLRRGPGVLPLSVLGALPPGMSEEDGIADVVARLCRRVERTLDRQTANHVLTSTFVLSGLRLKRERALNLFRRIRAVEESTTYQYIIEQGGLKQARRMLIQLGADKFGAPTKKVRAAIQESEDLQRLERMVRHVLTATSWNEVVETP